MGIQNLLTFVKKACHQSSLDEFKGKTVAVDCSCWLYKGAYGCGDRLYKGLQTDQYVKYCLKLTKLLLSNDIHVIIVFDGASLPAKSTTDAARRERRKVLKGKAELLSHQGKQREADECLRQAVEITPEMKQDVIKACRALPNVDCIVAPFEADAQLAYLCKVGIADLVITEDSDLIAFGCEKIFFKLDMNGRGVLYERDNIGKCFGLNAEKFTFSKFRRMCILSGCDYLPSLPGIGLAKAAKFFAKISSDDLTKILKKIPYVLGMKNLTVSKEYIEGFIEAERTFLYQLAFDPTERTLKPLNPYPTELSAEMMTYAGRYCSDKEALQVALGNTNPRTKERMGFFSLDDVDSNTGNNCVPPSSIWHPGYNPKTGFCGMKEKEAIKDSAIEIVASKALVPRKEVLKKGSLMQNVATKRPGSTLLSDIPVKRKSVPLETTIERDFLLLYKTDICDVIQSPHVFTSVVPQSKEEAIVSPFFSAAPSTKGSCSRNPFGCTESKGGLDMLAEDASDFSQYNNHFSVLQSLKRSPAAEAICSSGGFSARQSRLQSCSMESSKTSGESSKVSLSREVPTDNSFTQGEEVKSLVQDATGTVDAAVVIDLTHVDSSDTSPVVQRRNLPRKLGGVIGNQKRVNSSTSTVTLGRPANETCQRKLSELWTSYAYNNKSSSLSEKAKSERLPLSPVKVN